MASRKRISPAERRHLDYLRRKGLQVASVYETRLAKARRKELRRVLGLALDYSDPIQIVPLLENGLDETGYLPGWWEGLYIGTGLPRAKSAARDLREAKAAEEEDIWLGTLRRYAQERAANEVRVVSGTWKDSLVRLARGIMEQDLGLGVEKLTKRIYERYVGDLEKWQVRRIAQTEAMIGMAEASAAAARTLSIPYTKEWAISGLGNTRPSHEAMDGVRVDEDEPFRLEGGLMLYPHDTSMGADAGEIINCACDCIRRPKGRGSDAVGSQAPDTAPAQATPATPPLSADEQRIQELMKDYADQPEEVQRALAENDLALEKELGVKKGKPMSVEKADKQSANPNYVAPYIEDPNGLFRDSDGNLLSPNPDYKKSDKQFDINCVTCANAYLLRLRGFDITAKGRIANSGSLNDKAAEGFNMFNMWTTVDKKRAVPTDMRTWMGKKKYKSMTQGRYKEFFDEACKEPGDYLTAVGWGKVNGHATIIRRTADGNLYYIEPQTYKEKKGVLRFPEELYKRATSKPRIVDGVLRVNDLIFDTHWAGLFDAK